MKKIISPAFFLFFLIFTASPARAIHFQSADNLTLPQDKTFNETVFVAATTLTINSPINGDLYCAGRDVLINAPVAGDVICAAETIKISGKFTGNLRVAGRIVDTDAVVHSTAMFGAQTLTVRPNADISGDLIAAASNAYISGKISRDMALGAESIVFSGQLLRNAKVAGSNISFTDLAKVGGALDLYSQANSSVNIPTTAVVGGINRHEIQSTDYNTDPKAVVADSPAAWFTKKIIAILSFTLVGLLLLTFTRVRASDSVLTLHSRPFASFFSGFGVLLLTPIFFIMALISIIGVPAAFIILFVYIIGIIISSVITSIAVGQLIITRAFTDKKVHTHYYYLLAGVAILWLLFSVPGFGWFLGFISLCLGLGSYFLSFLPAKAKK